MVNFWLDANAFITPKNGFYSFDIAPGFWQALDQKANERAIASPMEVYEELARGRDELAAWVRARKTSGLFIEADGAVQTAFQAIANYVKETYAPELAADFLRTADPWLVAHARAYGGQVVTYETRDGDGTRKVKIPSVCDYFDVVSVTLYEMLRSLNIVLDMRG